METHSKMGQMLDLADQDFKKLSYACLRTKKIIYVTNN